MEQPWHSGRSVPLPITATAAKRACLPATWLALLTLWAELPAATSGPWGPGLPGPARTPCPERLCLQLSAPSVQPPAPPHWLHKHFQHLTAHPQTWNQGLGRGLTDAARARWHTAARGGSRCPCSHASLGCPPRTPVPLSRAGPHRASAAGDGSCAHATRGWSSWPGRAPLRHLGSDPAGGRLSLPAFHLNPCKRAATGPVALRLGSPGFRPSAAGWGSCPVTAPPGAAPHHVRAIWARAVLCWLAPPGPPRYKWEPCAAPDASAGPVPARVPGKLRVKAQVWGGPCRPHGRQGGAPGPGWPSSAVGGRLPVAPLAPEWESVRSTQVLVRSCEKLLVPAGLALLLWPSGERTS